jgi:hypothetical protein
MAQNNWQKTEVEKEIISILEKYWYKYKLINEENNPNGFFNIINYTK